MAQPPRRYLDHAATSWPKPPSVYDAWERAARSLGVAAGRGAYSEAIEAGRIIERARAVMAALLGGVDPDRIAFPAGGTLALNMAIHGLLQTGDHVIATAADHNATLRPLQWLASRGVITLDIVPCDGVGRVDPDAIAGAWRPATRLVTCVHASNVTGAVQDVAGIARMAHDRGGLVLLDAAQTLGQVGPAAFAAIEADMLAAPTHKWLQGPMGAGVLFVRPGLDIAPLVQGGTGSASDSLEMPGAFSDAMEAGTPDLPAIAGLVAAVEWLQAQSIPSVAAACRGLARDCAVQLAEIPGVRVIAAALDAEAAGFAPIVSFTVAGFESAEVAAVLEQAAGVQARSGFHCAARIHEHLGTAVGGTVRVSYGPLNVADDVAAVVETVAMLVGG
jgi:cysteine desulfurase / selenocysteine lyase